MSDPLINSASYPWSIWSNWLNQIMTSAGRGAFPAGILNEPILPNGTFAGVVINENNSSDTALQRLLDLQAAVTRIKEGTARGRFERVKVDLAWLKLHQPDEYQQRLTELGTLPARSSQS